MKPDDDIVAADVNELLPSDDPLTAMPAAVAPVGHQAIAAASHNRILREELRRLTVKISPYRRTITFQPGRMESSIPEHEQIMQAIFRGDAVQASQLMRSHVTLLGDGLSDLLHFLRLYGDQKLLTELA